MCPTRHACNVIKRFQCILNLLKRHFYCNPVRLTLFIGKHYLHLIIVLLLSPYFIYKRSIVHFLLKLFLSLCIRKVGWISQLHWSFLLLIFIPFLCVVLHQVFILIKFYVSIFSYSTVVFTYNNVWFNNTEQCKTLHTHNILNNSFIEIFIIEEKLPFR